MRKVFIAIIDAPTREDAEALAPWACTVYLVEGGWLAFESATDADYWFEQA